MTTIYLIRHSEALKPINIHNGDSLQVQNEKWGLTLNGEKLALKKSKIDELKDFDIVIASNYLRAISTARYFTNKDIYIDENFGERKFGVSDFKDLPKDFYDKQIADFDYKLSNGESLNEVLKREEKSLNNILKKYKDKKVLIVGHSTAFSVLLSKWCDVGLNKPYKFNNKEFFSGKWHYCETFKLIFDEKNNLINIENIK